MKRYFLHYDKLISESDANSKSSNPKSKRLYIKDRVNMLRNSIIYKSGYSEKNVKENIFENVLPSAL